jgi:hypothetical protein
MITRDMVLSEWPDNPSAAKRLAAAMAKDLDGKPRGTQLESGPKLARRHNVPYSRVVSARVFLMGAELIHQVGPSWFTA